MKGPIRPVRRERRQDRADATLSTAWVGLAPVAHTWAGGKWLSNSPPSSFPRDDAPVLVMLGSDDAADATLNRCILDAARAYVLVGAEVDLDEPTDRVLVRRVAEVPASALYSETESRIWIGGTHSLKLDSHQAAALRQTFLRLFWHEAKEEAWLEGGKLVWRPARERPFDVPEVGPSASIRWEAPDARLRLDVRGARAHLVDGQPPTVPPRRLWFRSGPSHHEHLAKLAQAGSELVWGEINLPDIAVTNDSGEMLLPGTQGRLRIQLTGAQAKEAGPLLDEQPSWTFRAAVRIGDPSLRQASFWLSGEDGARTIEEEQRLEIAPVSAASLRAVDATEPPSWPAPQPLALAALYRWTVLPPSAPTGAQEDPLVKRWRALDEDWTKRLTSARDALMSSDGERLRLGKAFARLVSAMLGFELSHKELLAQVTSLETQRPSKAGPEGAAQLLAELEKLEVAAKKHQGDLEEAERTAREQEEQDKQRAEWTASIERAKADVAAVREELAKAETREAELEEEAKELAVQLKAPNLDEKKDLDVKQKRNGDERKRHSEYLKKLRYDLKKLEDAAARPFVFSPSKPEMKGHQPQGKRFIPSAPAARPSANVPEDALPEVGSLRTHRGQRYLVIDVWEHLDAGEQAAARLSAKLVAPENA
jgi:hypothetical protein